MWGGPLKEVEYLPTFRPNYLFPIGVLHHHPEVVVGGGGGGGLTTHFFTSPRVFMKIFRRVRITPKEKRIIYLKECFLIYFI